MRQYFMNCTSLYLSAHSPGRGSVIVENQRPDLDGLAIVAVLLIGVSNDLHTTREAVILLHLDW